MGNSLINDVAWSGHGASRHPALDVCAKLEQRARQERAIAMGPNKKATSPRTANIKFARAGGYHPKSRITLAKVWED